MRRNSALWKYLESCGVLTKSDEEIAQAKRTYWKQYHYNHRKAQRTTSPEVIISLSRKDGTYDMFADGAKKHHMTLASFIRACAKSYLLQTYIVPDRAVLMHLEGLLSQCANELQAVAGAKEKYFWQREQKIEQIETRIVKLEGELRTYLTQPPNLDQEIIKAISRAPETRERLLALLTSHDSQIKIKEK